MATELELAYLAGIVDGEGYIGIKRSKAYRCQGRATAGYHARIQIRLVDEPALRVLAEPLGGWYYRERAGGANRRPLFCYQASNQKARRVLQLLLPYLRVKRRVASFVLSFLTLKDGAKQYRTKVTGHRTFTGQHGQSITVRTICLSDAYVALCHQCYDDCKRLNRVGVA